MIKGWKNSPAWVKIYAEKKDLKNKRRINNVQRMQNEEMQDVMRLYGSPYGRAISGPILG